MYNLTLSLILVKDVVRTDRSHAFFAADVEGKSSDSDSVTTNPNTIRLEEILMTYCSVHDVETGT